MAHTLKGSKKGANLHIGSHTAIGKHVNTVYVACQVVEGRLEYILHGLWLGSKG